MLSSGSGLSFPALLVTALGFAVALTACSAGVGGGTPTAAIECTAGNRPVPEENAERVALLRRTVESSPLYRTASRVAPPAECRVRTEGTRTELDYRFRDGSRLHVTRDDLIEFSEQTLEGAAPLRDDPVGLLKRAEQASFGEKGCGIRWQSPGRPTSAANAARPEDVFYGEICNCQARIRRDRANHAVALTLRSAC